MNLIGFAQKNKVGAIIAGIYFLTTYYLLDAKISVTRDILMMAPLAAYAFWIDLVVAVLVGALLQMLIERYAK